MDFKLRPLIPPLKREKTATDFAPIRCPNCDRSFYPRQPTQIFCKTSCRRAHWARHRVEPLPVYVEDAPTTTTGPQPSDPQFITKIMTEPSLEELERAEHARKLREIGFDFDK